MEPEQAEKESGLAESRWLARLITTFFVYAVYALCVPNLDGIWGSMGFAEWFAFSVVPILWSIYAPFPDAIGLTIRRFFIACSLLI